jgi:hypothetical protein
MFVKENEKGWKTEDGRRARKVGRPKTGDRRLGVGRLEDRRRKCIVKKTVYVCFKNRKKIP